MFNMKRFRASQPHAFAQGAYRIGLFLTCTTVLSIWAESDPGAGQGAAAKKGPPKAGGTVIEANLTTYYIAEVEASPVSDGATSGVPVMARDLAGKQERVLVPVETLRRAEMQSLAMGQKGRMWIQVGNRIWEELPAGWMGMGNRVNPIVPYLHVAADQSKYPYGSLIYFPAADGYTNVNGAVMDGCFWVADVGGMIKGRSRFDVFVGHQKVFDKVMDRGNGKLSTQAIVYRLPKAPNGFDPGRPEGLAAVLRASGHLPKSEANPTPEALRDALIKFQKTKPKIPEVEYGMAKAATTLWYLMEAAVASASSQTKK
jgi:3D (Asp-Asp-Asp) domain-containing protein